MTTQTIEQRHKPKAITSVTLSAWLMWICGALYYFYEFLVQISPSVMSAELMRDFSIHADKLGMLVGIFALSYACITIPAGVLLDKFGPRRVLTVASSILALGCFLFSGSSSFYIALIGRLFMGLGAAFAVIGCMKIATNWFPIDKFALILGLTVSVGMSGAIFGSATLAIFMEHYHWRECMYYLTFAGIIFSLVFILVVRDRPSQNSSNCFI